MPIKVGINGFGRIGRVILRTCIQKSDIEVSAINDPAVDNEYICYLIKFDSTHGKFNGDVAYTKDDIIINGNKIRIFHEKLPSNTPWHTAGVQYVVESSGMFTNLVKASGHLASGSVKRVILTAPSIDVPMMILGVNEDKIEIDSKVISCASSTLYCLAPIIKILEDNYGISEGFITSIHAMTPSLKPLDGLCLRGRHWRDHRSIHQNIIPAVTGACKALSKIIPQVKDKMTGLAFRVPIVNVSVLDITIRLKKKTSIENIIRNVENESMSSMKNVIKVSRDDAVSSDFLGDDNSCILDINSSLQLTENFFKLICWYENEFSYACRVIDSIRFSENQLAKRELTNDMIGKALLFSKPRISQSIISNKPRHEYCNYGFHVPSVICSTSQETGLRTKIYRQHIPYEKTTLQAKGSNQTAIGNSWEQHELVKVWNDSETTNPQKHNRNSLFSCESVKPSNTFVDCNFRTQEKLETVKKEFTKMVNMTEELLKKSNCDKSLQDLLNNSSEANVKNNEVSNNNDHIINEDCTYSKLCQERNEPYQRADKYSSSWKETETRETDEEKYATFTESKHDNNQQCPTSEVSKKIDMFNKMLDKDYYDNFHSRIDTKYDLNENTVSGEMTYIESKNHTESLLSNYNYKDQIKEDGSNLRIHNGNLEAQKSSVCLESNEKVLCDSCVLESTETQESDKIESNATHHMEGLSFKKKFLESIVQKFSMDDLAVIPEAPLSIIPATTDVSNGLGNKTNPDLYDKLDSVSDTDSDNSFQMSKKKSQVINITDLTNSFEDLTRLDKLCRIIEISDELSDQLFSALDSDSKELGSKTWSFKDLCERINLDEFCNKVFVKSAS